MGDLSANSIFIQLASLSPLSRAMMNQLATKTVGGPERMAEEWMFTLGLDFGTNSVRALVVRCSDGAEYGSCVVDYPSGAQGVLLDPKDGLLARQHPGDYLFGLEESVRGALAEASARSDFHASKIIGVGVDTTGSSPLPVDDRNRPLALSERWKSNLSAQCWLWKDRSEERRVGKEC